jgi:hypothetical protein
MQGCQREWLIPRCSPKTLDIRLCTDRRQDVAVIFSFGLDALFTRYSRAHSSAVLSLCPHYWLLLALTVIEPVAIGSYSYQTSFNSLLSSFWAL